jgi:hypothetical protein
MKEKMFNELLGSIKQGGKLLKKIKYANEKIRKVEIVKDFLPSPEELVFNKMKLNKEEKELLKSYDIGELKTIKDFTKKKNEYQQIARNT